MTKLEYGDATHAQSRPTGHLRWRQREPSEGLPGRELQQEWETITFRMGTPNSRETEWRDVPVAK